MASSRSPSVRASVYRRIQASQYCSHSVSQSSRTVPATERQRRDDSCLRSLFFGHKRCSVPTNRSSLFVSRRPKGKRYRASGRDTRRATRQFQYRISARLSCPRPASVFRRDASLRKSAGLRRFGFPPNPVNPIHPVQLFSPQLKKEKQESSADRSRIALSRDEMRKFGYRVVDLLAEHFASVQDRPVGNKADLAQMISLFDHDPPEAGRDPNELLAQLERDVFPNNLHVDHPRFFAFVPGPNNFVSTMADALAAGFNIFNGTWLGGSAAAAVELGVVRWLSRICEFPATAGGLFISGGSMANLTALVAARHALLQDRIDGATIYFSDQTHSSVERALRVIGFLPEQLRKLGSDGNFRLSIQNLRGSIADDRAKGLRPFCIVANAGTTNTGAVDPLSELADLAAKEKLWLHVDGAFGAASILSKRGREMLDGLD